MVEVTNEFNAIRQIKIALSSWKPSSRMARFLDSAMDVFADDGRRWARVIGMPARRWRAISSPSAAFWGRTKLALDGTPYTVPTLQRPAHATQDDIINFEIVYESPWGYWLEMTAVFSFEPLPADSRALLDGYLAAVEASSAVAKAGNTFRDISDANDNALRERGFPVDGKHTPDCHSTGLGRQRWTELPGRARFRPAAEYGAVLSPRHGAGE